MSLSVCLWWFGGTLPPPLLLRDRIRERVHDSVEESLLLLLLLGIHRTTTAVYHSRSRVLLDRQARVWGWLLCLGSFGGVGEMVKCECFVAQQRRRGTQINFERNRPRNINHRIHYYVWLCWQRAGHVIRRLTRQLLCAMQAGDW